MSRPASFLPRHLAFALATLAACLTLLAAPPAGAVGEQTGRVRGTVSNAANGQALEGVMVEAKSPQLIGGPATAMTDGRGRFDLSSLPPGPYSLSFSYPGTVPAVRNIEIRQGETVGLVIQYALESEKVDTVNLAAGRQLTRSDSTHTGSVKEMRNINKLPTGRSYQSIAAQVPAVNGVGNPNVKGGLSSHNKYLIDGIDATDPVTNTFAQNLTFDSMGSLEVLTGGMDAEYNAIGGVINVVTRGGSEKSFAVGSVYLNDYRLSARGNFGSNLYEDNQPFNKTEPGPNQALQVSLNAGGPVPFLEKKLWYSLTYQFDRTEFSPVKARPLGVAPYDIQPPSRVYTGHTIRGRLGFAPTARNRFWVSANADPADIDNNNRTAPNNLLAVAQTRQEQGGYFALAGWEWQGGWITPSLQVGYLKSRLEIGPQGLLGPVDYKDCNKAGLSQTNCSYDFGRPRHINTLDNTTWYQGPAYQIDNRTRLQVDPSVRFMFNFLGRHRLKAGVQAQFTTHSWDYKVPGGSLYRDRSPTGALLEAGLCDPAAPGPNCNLRIDTMAFITKEKARGLGLYVQDSWWTPLEGLTINPGLRFDYGYAEDWQRKKVASLKGFAPRLGFTADLTKDARNVFFGFYGRATEPVSLDTAADTSSTEAGVQTYHVYNPMTGMFEFDSKVGGPGGIQIDYDAKMPHSDEITFGFRREILPNSVGSVEYSWKRITNSWASTEINQIWDPSGTRVVGYVDPAKPDQEVWLYHTPDDSRYYHGLIFSTEGQPTDRVDFGASYVLSWTTFGETADNPRLQQFYQGFSSSDIRHYMRGYGSYSVTEDLVVGATSQWQSGASYTKNFFNPKDGTYDYRRSPAGTTTGNPNVPSSINEPNAIAELRTPGFFTADLHVAYNLLPRIWKPQRLDVMLDVFNLFDTRAVDSLNVNDDPQFGTAAGRRTPLRVQLALRYEY